MARYKFLEHKIHKQHSRNPIEVTMNGKGLRHFMKSFNAQGSYNSLYISVNIIGFQL